MPDAIDDKPAPVVVKQELSVDICDTPALKREPSSPLPGRRCLPASFYRGKRRRVAASGAIVVDGDDAITIVDS